MKTRITFIFCALCAFVPSLAKAQGTVNDLETELRGRITVEGDWKISKGLHLSLEAEGRFTDNFSSFSRAQTGLGISYKLNKNFKIGGGYLFMENKNSSAEWKTRHRLYLDAAYGFKSGDWRFSVKERIQYTHKDVNNAYQKTPNLLASKTRFKASYNGFGDFKPYALLEARLVLNDPAVTYSSSRKYDEEDDYYYWPVSDINYTDTYLNRFRGGLGVEYKLDKKNSIDIYGLLDYCYDKEIDTNKKGTKLKSLTWNRTLAPTVGVTYKFSF